MVSLDLATLDVLVFVEIYFKKKLARREREKARSESKKKKVKIQEQKVVVGLDSFLPFIVTKVNHGPPSVKNWIQDTLSGLKHSEHFKFFGGGPQRRYATLSAMTALTMFNGEGIDDQQPKVMIKIRLEYHPLRNVIIGFVRSIIGLHSLPIPTLPHSVSFHAKMLPCKRSPRARTEWKSFDSRFIMSEFILRRIRKVHIGTSHVYQQ